MTDAGSALMGIGEAGGENRAETAARMAIASHLLEVSIEGAKGVLFNVVGGPDLGMEEIDRAAKIIAGAADPDANIIFGATIKDDLVDRIRISVIATGFDQTRAKLREYAGTGLSQLTGMGMPQPQPQAQTQITSDDDAVNQDDTQSEVEIEEPDDEERLNIPAFLRRGN